jgi:diguanylate cyclase
MNKEDIEGQTDPVADFFEFLPEASFIVDQYGSIESLNRTAASLLYGTGGVPERKLSILDLLAEEYRGYALHCIQSAASGKSYEDCRVVMLADGKLRLPVSLALFPLSCNGLHVGITAKQLASGSGLEQHGEDHVSNASQRGALPLWAADLPGAWSRGELVLHYQPQWNIVSGQLIGMEALLRWHHPKLGLIPPSEFIPYAEESEWIMEMGEWVMREAASQNKRWQEAGFPSVPVSVNCSVKQFGRSNIVGNVFQILRETGLDPQYLKLEITESISLFNEHDVVRKIKDFQNFRVYTSIDDFGTGFSSLSYLYEMPVHVIKLDRSFLDGVENNTVKSSIISCVIELARRLNVKVMAEGLETKEQLMFLRTQGCEEAQGYYMNRPMTVQDIESQWRSSSLAAWVNRLPA